MTWSAVDLFCGAGGLSHGLEQAGFVTVLALDNDPDACQTYRAAFPKVLLHRRDIRGVDFRCLEGVDLIAGGPPCQPFSIGGRRLGKGDGRDLLPEFVRAVAEARPRAFFLENVPGLASPAHHGYLIDMLAPLRDGFSLFGPYVVNAADYRVPQSRRRLVVIGMAEGVFYLPPAMSNKRLTAGDVLTRDPVGEPNSSKIVYAKNPDLRPNPYHGHLFNGGGRPIDPEAPAPTILASAGGNKTHFIDGEGRVPGYHRHLLLGGKPCTGELPGARRLTVAECAVLQTFPAATAFAGARSSQYEQVGNAVPSRLAAALAEAILTGLNRIQQSAHARAVA